MDWLFFPEWIWYFVFLFKYTFFMYVDFSFLVSLLAFGWTGKEYPKATPFSSLIASGIIVSHLHFISGQIYLFLYSLKIRKTKRQTLSTLVWYLHYFFMELQKHAIEKTVVQKWNEMKLVARAVRDLRKLNYRLMFCFQVQEYDEWWEIFNSHCVMLNMHL